VHRPERCLKSLRPLADAIAPAACRISVHDPRHRRFSDSGVAGRTQLAACCAIPPVLGVRDSRKLFSKASTASTKELLAHTAAEERRLVAEKMRGPHQGDDSACTAPGRGTVRPIWGKIPGGRRQRRTVRAAMPRYGAVCARSYPRIGATKLGRQTINTQSSCGRRGTRRGPQGWKRLGAGRDVPKGSEDLCDSRGGANWGRGKDRGDVVRRKHDGSVVWTAGSRHFLYVKKIRRHTSAVMQGLARIASARSRAG